jgi:Leucine-rich repeat (LRR) protein
MANMNSLDLSSNSLKVLHTFVLAGFPLLRTLNLSHNQIHSVTEGAFILPSLHELDLSQNQMTEISSHLFETSPHLDIIIFAHNKAPGY